MLANRLLLVSFNLFYIKTIYGPTGQSSSGTPNVAVQNRRTVLTPYQSKYNDTYEKNPEFVGRKILTAKLVDQIRAPFRYKVWKDIKQLPKIAEEVQKDDLPKTNETVIKIYNDVLCLLFKKMKTFNNSNDDWKTIESYLGYGEETKDLINIAVTELMRLQRENVVQVNNLMNVFYYSCDLKYMHRYTNTQSDLDLIKKKFSEHMNKFPELLNSEEMQRSEENIVDALKSNLRKIQSKTIASLGVSVPAMKIRVLLNEPSDNELLKAIQNQIASVRQPIIYYVKSISVKQNAKKIMLYHVEILGMLTTHAFGYIHNHFGLLSELRKHEIEQEEHTQIKNCSRFMNGFMSVFLERYFEFKGLVSQEIVNAMFLLLEFLEPSDSQTVNDENLAEAEKSALNEPSKPMFSISNYFQEPRSEGHVKKLIDDAVMTLVQTFHRILVNTWDTWDDATKINYRSLEKKALLELMEKNYINIIDILGIFSSEFSLEKELYDKYKL